MSNVYVLQHVHETEGGAEDVKFIGVYSSRETARKAIERLSHAPGFSDSAIGFHIDEYQLDQDHWVEGYVLAGTHDAPGPDLPIDRTPLSVT